MCIYIYICMYVYVCVYVYIYICCKVRFWTNLRGVCKLGSGPVYCLTSVFVQTPRGPRACFNVLPEKINI